MTREELVQRYYGNEGKIGGAGFGDLVGAKPQASNPIFEVGKAIGDDLMLSLKSIPHLPAALLPSNGTMGWLDPAIPEEERQMRRRAVANAAMLLSGAGFAALGSKLVAGTAPTIVRALLHPGTVGAVENVVFGEIDRDPAERGNRGIEMAGDAALGAGFGLAGRAIARKLGARTVKKAAEEAAETGGRAARRQAEDILARMAVARANPSRLLGGIGSADADQILADATPEVQAAVKSLLGEMDLEERIAALAGPERTPQSMSLLDNTIRIMNERKASADAGDFDWMDDAIRRAAAVSEGEVKSQAALQRGDYILPNRDGMRKILHTEASYHPTFKDRNERLKFASELLGRNVSTYSDLDSQEALYVVNAMRITRGQSPFVPPSSGVFRPIKAGKGTSMVQFPDQVHAQFYDLADDLKTRILDTKDLDDIAKVMDIPVDAVPAAAKMYRDWVDATVQSLGDVKMDMLSFHDFMEKIPSLVTLSRTQVLQAITDRQNGLAASRMGLANARSVPAAPRAQTGSRTAAVGRARAGKQAQESSDHLGTGAAPGEPPAPTGGGGGPVSWDNPVETRRPGSGPAPRRPFREANIRWKDVQGDLEPGAMHDEQLAATRKMLAQETAAMKRLSAKEMRTESDETTLAAIRERIKVLTDEVTARERFLNRGDADEGIAGALAKAGVDEQGVQKLMAIRNAVRTTGDNSLAKNAAIEIAEKEWLATQPPGTKGHAPEEAIAERVRKLVSTIVDDLTLQRPDTGPAPRTKTGVRAAAPRNMAPIMSEAAKENRKKIRKLNALMKQTTDGKQRAELKKRIAELRQEMQSGRRLSWRPSGKAMGKGLSEARTVTLSAAVGRRRSTGEVYTRTVSVSTAREDARGIYRIVGWEADDKALLPDEIGASGATTNKALRKLEAGRDILRTVIADLYNNQGAVAIRLPNRGPKSAQLKLVFEQLVKEGRLAETKSGLYSLKSNAGIGPQRVTKESIARQRPGSPALERRGQQLEASASVMLRRLGYDPRNMASSKIEGVWRSEAGDQPVKVIGSYGVKNGIEYLKIEGSNTGIPANQFLSNSNMKLNTDLQKLDEEARRAYETWRQTGKGKEYQATLADIEKRRAEVLDKDPVGKTIAKYMKQREAIFAEVEKKGLEAGQDPNKVRATATARVKAIDDKISDLRARGAASQYVELPKFEEPKSVEKPAAAAASLKPDTKGLWVHQIGYSSAADVTDPSAYSTLVKKIQAEGLRSSDTSEYVFAYPFETMDNKVRPTATYAVIKGDPTDARDTLSGLNEGRFKDAVLPENITLVTPKPGETLKQAYHRTLAENAAKPSVGGDELPDVPKEQVVDPDALRPSPGVVAEADAPTPPAKKGRRKKPVASPKMVDERTALRAIQAEIRAVKGKKRKTEQLYNNEEFGNRVLNLVEQYKKAGVEVPRSLKAAERRVTLRLENQERRARRAAEAEQALAASPEDVKMLAMASNGLLDEVQQAIDAVGGRATALPEDVKAAIRARTEELLGHYKARGLNAPGGLWIAHRQASPKKGT